LLGAPEELLERGVAAAFFPHGVGHLLGLDVHDMEDLGDRAGYAPGRTRSTVAAEPGFYNLEGLLDDSSVVEQVRSAVNPKRAADLARLKGIRIEDDVLVTEQGSEVLTAAIPKTRVELEASIRAVR
jgi:Xaa-Pro aminopeptidase